MKFRDMISMCLSNLFKRKVRTLLTVIGVVIGTCAIVVMISLGIGMQQSQKAALEQMGDLTLIQIYNWSGNSEIPSLDDTILEEIQSLEHVSAVTPAQYAEWGQFQIVSGKYVYDGTVYGVYMDQLEELGYVAQEGTLDPGQIDKHTIVFGSSALYNFYNSKKQSNNRVYPYPDENGNMPKPYVDVLNDKLEIKIQKSYDSTTSKKPKSYKVDCNAILMEDWNKNPSPGYAVFMDINFLRELSNEYKQYNGIKIDRNAKVNYEQVTVKVEDMKYVAEVEEIIQGYGYETNSMETIRKPLEEQARQQQIILGGLGAISLLVAAIGITNTMIMSIYERTREIGVMKVLGCVVGNIRAVFLMEAGTIGFFGGVLGVALSYLISFIINSVSAGGGGNMDYWQMISGGGIGGSSIIPPWLVLLALIFSTLVGLISGFSPANRAVKISALTAIRQE